ncbi:NUDIX hydrolase [Shimia sp. R9_1]|uniref:NUDIX hydrolase n=1 Tax=Shimia sp. R9_1 TaxID=2821111 RepID=UPI001FFE113C|nr:NUDIX hydrolase [Shimia sp. R9_1]
MGLLAPSALEAMIQKARKTGKNLQFAALPYRIRKGKPQILMVTSRGTQQWIIPKGWPMDGMKPHKAAAQEAWEEAGITGAIGKHSIGQFRYRKTRGPLRGQKIRVMVFALEVDKLAKHYPEAGQRRRKWMRPKKAAKHIRIPELAEILRNFDTKQLKKRARS